MERERYNIVSQIVIIKMRTGDTEHRDDDF